jgi:pimeloyl-ACP methyl ester carboxylesterase
LNSTIEISTGRVRANGIEINVATAGSGPALLLLHGFPHTWEVWSRVIPALAQTHRIIAPDLRGAGGSSRAESGYDLATLSADASGLLDALGIDTADVMAMDAGAPVAFYLALLHPERVRRLIVMEAILGDLPRPGATTSPPWWFGFHAVQGLAEKVVDGHEDDYIGFFLDNGLVSQGMSAALRARFIESYRGTESLRCGFEIYRAFPANAEQIRRALVGRRLTVPTLAVGSSPIGGGLFNQLEPIADDVRGELIEDCGHIIPLDRPAELVELVDAFL